MNKGVMIDAIIGGSSGIGIDAYIGLEKLGLMEFTGNQWNESWGWVRGSLEALSFEELEQIYNGIQEIKRARDASPQEKFK